MKKYAVHSSLGPFGAPKGRRAKCKLSPLSAFFLHAIGGVSTKRRAMSFGYVVDMDEISKRFLTERDPTTGSGITGLESSEFPSLKRLRCRVGSAQQNWS